MPSDKLAYFATSAWKRVRAIDCACPNCRSPLYARMDQKYLVTELRRCRACRLMYRSPSDSAAENDAYYQDAYRAGFATDLPDDTQLALLKAARFRTTEHSYAHILSLIECLELPRGSRVFDYGCSWGYGTWQFRDAGYDVSGYEISRPRADFARRKLELNLLERLPPLVDAGPLGGAVDCFFSSHVIEHVPRPDGVIELARALLRPGGYFFAITPNGSDQFRAKHPGKWHRLWGKHHPNFIDDGYWRHALKPRPLLLATLPVASELVASFTRGGTYTDPILDGDELVCIARF